jgi:hypothetical protein
MMAYSKLQGTTPLNEAPRHVKGSKMERQQGRQTKRLRQ